MAQEVSGSASTPVMEPTAPPIGVKIVRKDDGTVVTGPYTGMVGSLNCQIMSALGGTVETHSAYAEKAVANGWQVWKFTDNEEGLVDSLWYRQLPYVTPDTAPL